MDTPTREVFANISPWMQTLFYVLIFASIGVLAWRIVYRFRVHSLGRPGGFTIDPLLWLHRLWTHAVRQKRVTRRRFAGILHLLLSSGFVVLTIGTTLLFIADKGPINFHTGLYYLIYEFTMDTFGVALVLGCAMAIYRRLVNRPRSLGHNLGDWGLLALLLALGVTGLILEALRLHYTQVPPQHARWSAVGRAIQLIFFRNLELATAQSWHLAVWWFHAVMVAVLFATLPVSRMLHIITGPINIATRPTRHIGALQPIAIEQVEATGVIGTAQIADLNTQQRLSLDACMECGRCEDACPAFASGKPLSPKKVITDLRGLMYQSAACGLASGSNDEHSAPQLHGQTILPDTLWACTMCQACVYECPVLIGHVDLIADMRRHLVAEGKIEGPPAAAMRKVSSHSNPYGLPNSQRLDWAAGLNVPVAQPDSNFDYLLWVGCSASFDPRAQKVARALVQLLQLAKINFAVLGTNERCTGDPARRLGDEFLFQQQARHNIATLNSHKVHKIITPCPHCANTLANEYPQFGGTFEVIHHSQFLADLIKQGKLQPPQIEGPYTLHDPCYLARVLGETSAPRTVLGTSPHTAPALAGVPAPSAPGSAGGFPPPLSLGEVEDPPWRSRGEGLPLTPLPSRERSASASRPGKGQIGNRNSAIGNGFTELPRHGDRTFCCGAGGGRMWFEESPTQRVSHLRAKEVIDSKATTLATACPFCLNMMTDGLNSSPSGEKVQVLDIAELLINGQPLKD